MNIVLNFVGLRAGGGRTDGINLLSKIPAYAPQTRFFAVVPAGCGYERVPLPPNCVVRYEHVRKFNDIWRIYFDNVVLRSICRSFKADVLFTMCNNGPLSIKSTRHVVMLRNAYYVYRRSEYADVMQQGLSMRLKMGCLRYLFRICAESADAIIVQTHTMRERLCMNYRVTVPVHVIGKNVTEKIKTHELMDDGSSTADRIRNHPADFKFLYLARYFPQKNMEKACEAVALVRSRGYNVTLFLTIEKDDYRGAPQLYDRIKRGDYGDAVINVGRVDFHHIEDVYGAVDAVLLPSVLESYSASYLEAMAYGKPLLVSDRDFAREVCADAAEYFEPRSTESIAASVERLIYSDDLRGRLVERGVARYAERRVTWEQVAKMYLDILLNT